MGGPRPETPIIGDSIPDALKARSQWVVWRWVYRESDGKWTKPPYNARTGALASSTWPHSWASFAEVMHARTAYDGIGYVLTDADPYVGIDLDNCRDLSSGVIVPWAQHIVDQMASYTEVSPSGTGLRILVEGRLPPGGRKHDDVEAYESGRYLTITGAHQPGTPATIEARQASVEAFHAEYFPPAPAAPPNGHAPSGPGASTSSHQMTLDDAVVLALARRARNGALFERLWSGDTMGDHSKGDLMLCGLLAFWCRRDVTQMDRLFRMSGLMRPKWDDRHSGDGRTYGQMTIGRAAAECRTVYEPPSGRPTSGEPVTTAEPWIPPLTLPAFIADPPPEPPWLIQGLIRAQTNGWLGAGAKVGKSYLALDLLLACALGRAWLGEFAIARPLRVVLIEEEDHPFRVYERIQRLIRGAAIPDAEIPSTFSLDVRKGYRLDDAATLAPLIDWLAELHADLVVWDVFNRLHLKDERKPDQIMPVLWQLDRIRDLVGCSNLLAHHQRKPGPTGPDMASGGQKLRGPSEFWGWAENSLYLTPLKGKGAIIVEPESKDAVLDPFKVHLEDVSADARRWRYDGVVQAKEGRGATVRHAIIAVLQGADAPMSASGIAAAMPAPKPNARSIQRHLSALHEDGAVQRHGTTRNTTWSVASEHPEQDYPPPHGDEDDPGF